jgi:hypothetical protein
MAGEKIPARPFSLFGNRSRVCLGVSGFTRARKAFLKNLEPSCRWAVDDTRVGKGWYRGADVDRLSEEEAGIIAARLVRRVQAKTALAKDKAEGLQRAMTDALRKKLTGDCCGANQKQSSIEDAAGKYLDQEQIKILREATDKGVRPLPNEE